MEDCNEKVQCCFRIASIVVVVSCILAILVMLVAFAINNSDNFKENRIELVLCEPIQVQDSVQYNKEAIDSLVRIIFKHEQQIADRYQYFLEQKEDDETLYSYGAILVGVVISLFGFFGYKSINNIEERAMNEVKRVTDQMVAKHLEQESPKIIVGYLKKNLAGMVEENTTTLFDSKAADMMKESVIKELLQQDGKLYSMVREDIRQAISESLDDKTNKKNQEEQEDGHEEVPVA